MYTRCRPKTFFLSFSAINENADEKEIPFMAENENGHSFSAEKRKGKSHDNISVSFHTFSHKSTLQCAANTLPSFMGGATDFKVGGTK